jgi:hypothetical protein
MGNEARVGLISIEWVGCKKIGLFDSHKAAYAVKNSCVGCIGWQEIATAFHAFLRQTR